MFFEQPRWFCSFADRCTSVSVTFTRNARRRCPNSQVQVAWPRSCAQIARNMTQKLFIPSVLSEWSPTPIHWCDPRDHSKQPSTHNQLTLSDHRCDHLMQMICGSKSTSEWSFFVVSRDAWKDLFTALDRESARTASEMMDICATTHVITDLCQVGVCAFWLRQEKKSESSVVKYRIPSFRFVWSCTVSSCKVLCSVQLLDVLM